MDVWGKFPHSTINGHNYFLTVVDDFTSTTWVYLMHFKSGVFSIINKKFNYIITHYNKLVTTVRSNNGIEFPNQPLKDLFPAKGIYHQLSYTYTSQQNGVVERKL